MSTLRTTGGVPSPARLAVRLFAEFAAFATLLFITRFITPGYLAVQLDEECHIGGIAVDVLAHGIRFPLLVYVQSDYDNGSLLSGLLTAVSFSLLGRSFLALKLVTHFLAAAGAVAALWLLRGCLEELGLTTRRVRWTATAALVIAIALAPRVVTLPAMCTVGIGSPLDGSVINTILLALFARRWHTLSAARTTALWTLVGLALYLNKATLPLIPLLGAVEIALAWRSHWRLIAAAAGFVLGSLAEVEVISRQRGAGWAQILEKVGRHTRDFPWAFLESAWTLAAFRFELIVAWALALCIGLVLLVRSAPQFRSWWRAMASHGAMPAGAADPPITLGIVVGATWLHTAALVVMAQGGFDYYTIYGYSTLVVLFAVLVAFICATVTTRWGEDVGRWTSAAAIAVTLFLYRPELMDPGFATVSSLWNNHAGAACSWRFAEGFRREDEAGLLPVGQTREQHIIERCRSLSEPDQVVDCIGGMARDLQYAFKGHVNREPPAALTPLERRAYAYYYGIRRSGDASVCNDFVDSDLRGDCIAAVQLDCLVRGGWGTRYSLLHGGHVRCTIPPPPMDGYWAALRTDFLAKQPVDIAIQEGRFGQDDELSACKPVFEACY